MTNENKAPWKDGFYRTNGMPSMIFTVEGESVRFEMASGRPSDFDSNPKYKGTWKYGNFGKANADVAAAAKKDFYNIDIKIPGAFFEFKGTVSENGSKIFYWGWSNSVEVFEWESEESIYTYKETGDPLDAPPSPYMIQPENQGKFLFISGAPGLGKSTTAQLLGRNAG